MVTVDTKIKEILNYPEAVKIINEGMKYAHPDYMHEPLLVQAYNMTFRSLSAYPSSGITAEAFEAIEEALEEAEIEDEDDE